MAHRLSALFNARLSRRIVLWVFASIILIEIIVLIPSVFVRERELLLHLTEISAARASGVLDVTPEYSERTILGVLSAAQSDVVLGGALYRSDGELVGEFGEPPRLRFAQIDRGRMDHLDRRLGRYDAVWKMPPIGNNYIVVIRHNADIRSEFLAFVTRVAGLVIIISVFVTIATMIVLNRLLIHPIMRLRRDLRRAGQALSQDQTSVVVPPLSSINPQRRDELGDVMAAFGHMVHQIAEAIAKRQQMEAELRISEEKFSKAFCSSPDAVIISTLSDGRLLEVNETFLHVVGLRHEEAINRTTEELGFWLNPADRHTMIATLQRDGMLRNQEYQFRAADGQIRTALYSAEQITLDGEVCILSVINDITERKQAEEALRESENRFRTLIAQAVDALFLVDQEGRFVDVNQQACLNLGYPRSELLSLSVSDIQTTLSAADVAQLWQQLAPGQPITLEGTHRRQDGSEFPVEVRLGMIQFGGRQLILALARDTTERKQAEAAIARLAEIGELSSMIVHEVRNPLTTVMMGLSSFKRLDLPERAQLRLDLAMEESERLQRLLNEILMYAKEPKLETVPVDLASLCREIRDSLLLLPAAQNQPIDLVVNRSAVVAGDRDKLKQVFINLITNACEASPPEMTVTWKVTVSDRQAIIQVHNGGEPIPPTVLPKLTQPFFTTKSSGNGLGLAITKRIVEAHAGDLQIDSGAEAGTTVTVTLSLERPRCGAVG
ncbi:MAG: PAS domain S-box protein [Elainellaceae cyanobacterium]